MTNKPRPDMRDRQQVAVRMTSQFAKDLNLLMASYKLSVVSYIVRESVGAQADYVRQHIERRLTGMSDEDDPGPERIAGADDVQTEVTDGYGKSQKEEA